MIESFRALHEWMQGKPRFPRHKDWRKVRAQHLKYQSYCQLCLTTSLLEVHHKKPYHLFPELELDLTNLVTLCEKNGCHFTWGHLRDWRAYNPDVIQDVVLFRQKIQDRTYDRIQPLIKELTRG